VGESQISLRSRRTLVTGGAGFIGSHLVRALVEAGARVRVLDNLSTGSLGSLAGLEGRIDFQEADIRNAVACRTACAGADTVFHLAAYISVPGSLQDPVTSDAINIGGTLNLLLAARDAGARRVVFSSSSAVYGNAEVLPIKEETPPNPLSPYGVEKVYGEQMCRVFSGCFGLETVALRYFNVYGPGQNPESEYAAVIPRFLARVRAGQPPVIFGDGEQTRDFVHVEDVARANLLAATRPGISGVALNVASGRPTSLNELARVIGRVMGSAVRPEHGPERPGDVRHSSGCPERARHVLGFAASRGLEAGLAQMARSAGF